MRTTSIMAAVFVLVLASAALVTAQTPEEIRQELRRVQEEMQRQQQQIQELEHALQEVEQQRTKALDATVDTLEADIPDLAGFAGASFHLAGYTALHFLVSDDADTNTFAVQWNPVFLFKIGDDLLFEGELGLHVAEDGTTELELEYAQMDWFFHPRVGFIAGKFLLPFSVFGERLHPAWINKFPSFPPIYQGEVVPTIGQVVLPVTSGIGVQLRGGAAVGRQTKINYALYVTNSPAALPVVRATSAAEAEAGGEEGGGVGSAQVRFGRGTDLTERKLFGGRFGILPIPEMEVGVSFMGPKAMNGSALAFWAVGVDAELHLFYPLELRGEYIRVQRALSDTDAEHFTREGYYGQATYRFRRIPNRVLNNLELAIRGGQTFEEGKEVSHQLALGLLYWIKATFVAKLAYEFNDGVRDAFRTDRFLMTLSYGF